MKNYNTKKAIFVLIGVIVLVGIFLVVRLSGSEDSWICVDDVWVKHGNPDMSAPNTGCGNMETGISIKLYFYNPKLDQGPGGAQCSRAGVVAVDRAVLETDTPLKDSINLLLRGELSDEEKAQGITTEFPLSGLVLKSAAIKDGVATLTFDDPQNKTSGGSCRAGVLWYQIEATAKQFPGVNSVKFMPESLFQP